MWNLKRKTNRIKAKAVSYRERTNLQTRGVWSTEQNK